MAGFTAERDMGTEGAGSADTAVRNAIDQGLMPGPRLRISGNAVDILGGHEDAIGYNPAQHVLPNATWANNAAELVTVIRGQFKEGADFIKIYETGRDTLRTGSSPRPTNTPKPSCAPPWKKPRAWANAWPCTPPESRARCMPRAPEWLRRSCVPAQRRDHAA